MIFSPSLFYFHSSSFQTKITVQSTKSAITDLTVFLICVLNTMSSGSSQGHVVKIDLIICHIASDILKSLLVSSLAPSTNKWEYCTGVISQD